MELFNLASVWVGRIVIVVFLTWSISRLICGQNAIDSVAGPPFALGVEWMQCLFFPCWNGMAREWWSIISASAFEKKDKDAQDGIIEWTAFLRFLQGLVHNFFNEYEKVETAVQKGRRYLDSDFSECSDPEYWQELHHGGDQDSSEPNLSVKDWQANYQQACQDALPRAWARWNEADAKNNYEMKCHYENIIDTLTLSWFKGILLSLWWSLLLAYLHWIYFIYEGAGMASADLRGGRSYMTCLLLEGLHLRFSASMRMFVRHLWVCSATTVALRLHCSFSYLLNLFILVWYYTIGCWLIYTSEPIPGRLSRVCYSFCMMCWVSMSRDLIDPLVRAFVLELDDAPFVNFLLFGLRCTRLYQTARGWYKSLWNLLLLICVFETP